MERRTRVKDKYECRIAGECPVEEWICECIDGELVHSPCDNCPIMEYINELAKYEDLMDMMKAKSQTVKEYHIGGRKLGKSFICGYNKCIDDIIKNREDME